jgi:hypothetical protein
MFETIFSLMDLIQYVLMVAACYACYKRGIHNGCLQTLEKLEEMGVVSLQRPEESEENS